MYDSHGESETSSGAALRNSQMWSREEDFLGEAIDEHRQEVATGTPEPRVRGRWGRTKTRVKEKQRKKGGGVTMLLLAKLEKPKKRAYLERKTLIDHRCWAVECLSAEVMT